MVFCAFINEPVEVVGDVVGVGKVGSGAQRKLLAVDDGVSLFEAIGAIVEIEDELLQPILVRQVGFKERADVVNSDTAETRVVGRVENQRLPVTTVIDLRLVVDAELDGSS